ncbi:response regulator transcription factor [Streptomyces sp. I05A-00742]|uniref:response regulator n=1 Tax=Streptomyces sp. I05A-00742 TaxID=2732853 RepID=UPI001488A3CF|nr:response regulator transcription factor [Streptomyces sp. I05A-00742]
MSEPIRVLIADDQALLRGSFRVLVDTEPGFTVVDEAADGRTAVELALHHRPDVVLMDVRMPVMDGIEAARLIRSAPGAENVRVLMLTMFDHDEYVFGALRAGAGGFLLKDASPDELLQAIRVLASGESLLAPTVTRRLIAEFCRRPQSGARTVPADLDELTARELDVLELITRGLTNAEIARDLRIRPATVKTHIAHLFDKLGVRDRVQLVIVGYESGMVVAGGSGEGVVRSQG